MLSFLDAFTLPYTAVCFIVHQGTASYTWGPSPCMTGSALRQQGEKQSEVSSYLRKA